ncbi:hypothetical protein ADK86_03160 [Streptomyces sp. NRRL F-5755]|uniref:hypothetical protein n=1 Tax=Streptomyces sp. NRRL F-5755 TaxID=1519475 RepID=UPI0006AE0F32|nr:hypothetical protein [Streptomyces sp. NRRL F-5755]KOU08777.1 hypothetical protein ADK86_03160 [Streptomyces sp. NRRL F-5755]
MAGIGPVQLLTVAFGPDAKFEGRIIKELGVLEAGEQIRVLDMLFVRKEPGGQLFTLDYQAESMGDTVAALLGLSGDRPPATEPSTPSPDAGGAFGLSVTEIRSMAEAMDPGSAAAFLLLEHVWATGLKQAIRGAGGIPVAEGFLTEEALAPVAAELALAAQRVEERKAGS